VDSNELLEKIDLIRDRMDVSYKEAREALEKAGGDPVEALVLLESQFDEEPGRLKDLKERWTRKIQGKSEEVVSRLKEIMEKGTAIRIRLKQGDRTLLEIPAGVGVLGAVGILMSTELAVLGAIGTVAALFNKCTLEVEGFGEPPGDEAPDQPPA
jgi:DNA-binding transcriptional MerR regulator